MSRIAEIISSFIQKTSEVPIENPSGSDIVVTEEFETALRTIESGSPFVFVTGKAGVGKSTFISLLKEKLNSYAIVAPTGVAALNVGGQTIHSFFKFAPGPIDFKEIKRVSNRTGYQALKTLIIDEVSMVRADLLDAIDLMLRMNRSDSVTPFGGVQVVAIGDLFQLPPIISTEEEQVFMLRGYKSPFFFGANSLSNLKIDRIEFTKVFRQTDAKFINLLNQIREGKKLEESLAELNKRVFPLGDKSYEGVVLSTTNDLASRINYEQLNDLRGETRIYTGSITGEFRVEKHKLPAPFELELKEGARVMFVKNDKQKRWVNGTIGVVTELGYNYVSVKLSDNFGDRIVRVQTDSWDNQKFQYDADKNELVAVKVGSYVQIPLTHAWAVTIHKSQGKTFDKVHINLGNRAFAEGQVYVALSRCRSLEGVTLEREIDREDINLSYDVIQFYKELSK